jgi:hypothetical protein
MTEQERAILRSAVIAGPGDCILSQEEAAAVMGVSVAWLRRSDVPVAPVAGGPKYLKSQCLAYVRVRLSARILETA